MDRIAVFKKKKRPGKGSQWAHVSKSKPGKVHKYYPKGKPSKEEQLSEERRIQFFKNVRDYPETMRKVVDKPSIVDKIRGKGKKKKSKKKKKGKKKKSNVGDLALSKRASKGKPELEKPILKHRPKYEKSDEEMADIKRYSPQTYPEIAKKVYKKEDDKETSSRDRTHKKKAGTSVDVPDVMQHGIGGTEGVGGKHPRNVDDNRIQGGWHFADEPVFVEDEEDQSQEGTVEDAIEEIQKIKNKYREGTYGSYISEEKIKLDYIKRGGLEGLIERLAEDVDLSAEHLEPFKSYYAGLSHWLGRDCDQDKEKAIECFARAVEKGSRGAKNLITKIKMEGHHTPPLSDIEDEEGNPEALPIFFKQNLDYKSAAEGEQRTLTQQNVDLINNELLPAVVFQQDANALERIKDMAEDEGWHASFILAYIYKHGKTPNIQSEARYHKVSPEIRNLISSEEAAKYTSLARAKLNRSQMEVLVDKLQKDPNDRSNVADVISFIQSNAGRHRHIGRLAAILEEINNDATVGRRKRLDMIRSLFGKSKMDLMSVNKEQLMRETKQRMKDIRQQKQLEPQPAQPEGQLPGEIAAPEDKESVASSLLKLIKLSYYQNGTSNDKKEAEIEKSSTLEEKIKRYQEILFDK